MKQSDLSTRYVLFVVDHVGVNAWDVLSAAVPPKVALAAIKREVDAGNLDYGVWLGRPFLTPQGRATLAELSRPRERQSPDRHTADPGYENATSLTDAPCNVAGCDHTRPGECEVVRCGTCGEPYDGTEPPARHIARAHLGILARERFGGRHGGIVRSDVTADNPGSFGSGCMFSNVARVFVLPDRTEEPK